MELTRADGAGVSAGCVGNSAGRTGSAADTGLAGARPKCAATCAQFSPIAATGISNQTHNAVLFRRFAFSRGDIESSAVINDSRYSSGDFPSPSRLGIPFTYPWFDLHGPIRLRSNGVATGGNDTKGAAVVLNGVFAIICSTAIAVEAESLEAQILPYTNFETDRSPRLAAFTLFAT